MELALHYKREQCPPNEASASPSWSLVFFSSRVNSSRCLLLLLLLILLLLAPPSSCCHNTYIVGMEEEEQEEQEEQLQRGRPLLHRHPPFPHPPKPPSQTDVVNLYIGYRRLIKDLYFIFSL
jgi:hypothetical protein